MQPDLKDLLEFLHGAVVPLLLAIAGALHGIWKDVLNLTKKMAQTEEWQRSHDAHCNERHDLHRRDLNNLWAEVARLRERR